MANPKRPITAGQVNPTRRRAIVLLFNAGMNFREVARLFHLRVHVVEEVFRRRMRTR